MIKELDNKITAKIIDDIIEWKKSTDKSWEYICAHIFYLDSFPDLTREEKEFYTPLFIKSAQDKILKEENTRGISVKHDRWCYEDNLLHDYQWIKFKEMMSDWSKERMSKVASQALDIVNFLPNPHKIDTSIDNAVVKGLVYGNVQSGKTAHIAALIALYASAGCKVIIVFSGITKSLRKQTQDRLRNDLGIEKYGCYDLITANSDLLGADEQSIEGRYYSNKPCIGVFKKSPAALKRLYRYLNATNDPHFWSKKQVLIIDDESDQYSINVKPLKDDETGESFERSTINFLLIKILNTFERYCYVGFTATPFANVLNELPGKDSLYPKDFIYPLEINEKYYGARKLFGSALEDTEHPLKTMNAINIVDDTEISPAVNDFDDIPKSLQDAINYFIIATACKYYRNIKKHSSMLVHLDRQISVHEKLEDIIQNYKDYVLTHYKKQEDNFREIWNKEKDRIQFDTLKELFSYDEEDKDKFIIPKYEELAIYINEVLSNLKVIVDNSSRPIEERLHYTKDGHDVVIVIGGNTLSRGLTLEGLLVSYFFRTSKLYDTLLQMGRWFGYRIGYEDLPRLYTTKEIAFKFSELADIEEEVRDQFSTYGFDITPSDISVKIRTLPSLQITRKNAMQSAVSTGVNYSGQRAQTLFFPQKDSAWLLHNQQCTKSFLDSLHQKPEKMNNEWLYQNISLNQIQDFTKELYIHKDNNSCKKDLLLKFMNRAKEKKYLSNWNIVVMSNMEGEDFQIASDLNVKLIKRSRYDTKDPTDDRIYLKVLQQPNNMLLDTDKCSTTPDNTPIATKFIIRHKYFLQKGKQEPGLLVIYPINKNSTPSKSASTNRLPLNAAEHVIGCMYVFPQSKDIQLDNYMTINLGENKDDAT